MLRRVQQYIRTQQLLVPGARVLVCVSGGADSVALLDVLQRGGYDCVVAHCNFHLRDAESNRDEQFVRQIAEQRGVAIHVASFDTQAYASSERTSIEVAARELRYRWFEQVATEEHCTAIAVAHHQNDQAETVLLNLLRGSGLRGLAGMRAKSINPVTGGEPAIIRPLLCTTHDYIVHYLRDIRHMDWVEDSTNADTAIRRYFIDEALATPDSGLRRGSLLSRMSRPEYRGKIFCKTGTMTTKGGSSLAGYIHSDDGHWYAFAIINVDSPVAEARIFQDKLCKMMIKAK